MKSPATLPVALLVALLACASASFAGAGGDPAPTPRWKYHTGGPILGSPVVSGGLVYFGGNDSTLYSLDAASGKTRWTFETRGPIRSTVAIDGDRLFLVGGDGIVRALGRDSGKVLWTFATEGEKLYPNYSYADYFFSSPVVDAGVVYFGSGDGHVYALNSATGGLVWKFKTGDVVHATPVLYGDKLFVGSFDGYVYALWRSTGELAWKFKSVGHRFFPAGEMQGNPVAGNGLVYVGSRDYNIYALDTAKGYSHWNRQFPRGWALALTAGDTVLYVGTSDDDLVLALDGRSGTELWNTDVHFNVFGAPALADSTVCVGTLHGKLLGLDRTTGAVRWSWSTDGYTEHHAEYFKTGDWVVKEEFYAVVGTPEGYIGALHKLGAIFSTPVVAGGKIYVTSTDGTLYCLRW